MSQTCLGYKYIEDRSLRVELYPRLGMSQRLIFHKQSPELADAILNEVSNSRALVCVTPYGGRE